MVKDNSMYSGYLETDSSADVKDRSLGQPGLEVAPSSDSQVLHPDILLDSRYQPGSLLPCSTEEPEWDGNTDKKNNNIINYNINNNQEPKQRWRRKRIWLVAVVVLLVILVIGLGVGLGVSKSKKSSNSGGDSKATLTPTASATAVPIADKQKQLAAGSAISASYGMSRFVYQNGDGEVLQAVWNTSEDSGPATATPVPGLEAKEGSPLSWLSWNNDQDGRLFYLSPKNILSDLIWSQGSWSNGTISSLHLQAHNSSQISAFYFESTFLCVYYQHPNETLIEYRYDLVKTKKWISLQDNGNASLPIANPGTGLAAVFFPTNQIRLLYQDKNLLIREYCWNSAKANDWAECTIVANLGLTAANGSTITAATWTNPQINDWILYRSYKDDSTISGVSYMNGSSFSPEQQILPVGVTLPDDARFSLGMLDDSEDGTQNEATVFFGMSDGGVGMVKWDESDRVWGKNTAVSID